MSEPVSTLWTLEPHSVGKHRVLRNYLGAWFPIIGFRESRMLFVDGFAGPGEYRGGEPGSPVIALDTYLHHPARDRLSEALFWFIEKNPERADHLRRFIEGKRPALPDTCIVHVEEGAFDQSMTRALDALDEKQSILAPAFVMVDPFGVSGTPMTVLERIMRNPKAELYVSFMYEAINRFRTTGEFGPHLDQLFGTDEWRKGLGITDPRERKEFYYSLYERQLRRAGAKQVVRFELYEGNRLVYAIFFGTQSITGSDRMKEAIWKVDPFGGFAFRGVRSDQIAFDLRTTDFAPLRRALTARFRRSDWVEIGVVEEFVKSDQTDFYLGQLRQHALIPMEKLGQLEVDKSSRKKRRSYPPGTRMRFIDP